VTNRKHRNRSGSKNEWYIAENGFWKTEPHIVLEQGFDYPELSVCLDQAVFLEGNGNLSAYRMWFQDFSREMITCAVENGGFDVQSLWRDLAGTPFTEDAEWIGVIAKKMAKHAMLI